MFKLAQSKTDSIQQTAHALSRFAWQQINSKEEKSRSENDLFQSLSSQLGYLSFLTY